MYSQGIFLKSILNFLSNKPSGALMISGAWGAGKTYYVKNTLFKLLNKDKEDKDKQFPILISLFGLNNLDDLEKRITEIFLQDYGETNLKQVDGKAKGAIDNLKKLLSKAKIVKNTQGVMSIAEIVPFIGQFVDVGRAADAYISLCSQWLPKEKIVLIFDDLERAIKTIDIHLLLGVINDLVETKDYKVILIANDSYFNKEANSYLDFKEKVIERTLFFPSDIISIYHVLIKDKGEEFEQWMSDPKYVDVINPDAEIYSNNKGIQENLTNLRILKFSVTHFFSVFEALSDTIKANLDNHDFQDFILSLWALTVGLSIEFKRNRLSYLDKDAFVSASAVQSLMIDLEDKIDINPFEEQQQEDNDDAEAIEKIRDIFKKYIECHSLPLVPSIHVFDLVTAGIEISKESLQQYWDEYRVKLEEQRQNPAVKLLHDINTSIGSYTNEEFPNKLQELVDYMKQAAFTNEESYINAASTLLRYGGIIQMGEDEMKGLIKKGIDKYYDHLVKLPELARTNLNMILPSYLPKESQWVFYYIKEKMDAQEDKEKNEDIEEAIRQFKEDLPAFAERLAPTALKVPDFYSFPILAKIPEQMIIDKLKEVEPIDIISIANIINSRFIQKQTSVRIDQEYSFLLGVQKGIQARNNAGTLLSDILIRDHIQPKLDVLLNKS